MEWFAAQYGTHKETIPKTRKRKPTRQESLQTNEGLLPTPGKQPHKGNSAHVKCEGETEGNQSPIPVKCESETKEDTSLTYAKCENKTKDDLFNASQETVHYGYDMKSDLDQDEKGGVLAKLLDDKNESDSEDDTLSWLINDDEKNQPDSSTTKLTVQSDDSSRDSNNDILLSFI